MNFDVIEKIISSNRFPTYHLKALKTQIGKGITSYDQLSSWPKLLRTQLGQIPFTSYKTAILTQGNDNSAKALLTFSDEVSIETVLIQTKPDHYSVCVSCQSGCAMGCAFCATGTLGLIRSLTAEEITDQLLYWQQTYPNLQIKSIVFMGMGEPFANQPAVFQAIDWFHTYYGLGYRHLTVSTSGLPTGITSLGNTYPQVNLAVSLHAANQQLRESIMPIAKAISLNDLAASIHVYLTQTNRQLTFEYLLIQDLNDSSQELDWLIAWLQQFPPHLVHVNLIGYNQTTNKFTKPSRNRIQFAKKYLLSHHISATIRKSLGEDIVGACGQLSLKSSGQPL